MGGQTGQELEYRQCHTFVLIIIIFYLLTGYFIGSLIFLMLIYTIIEEVDPEEVDNIEELAPFIDDVYAENDFIIVKSFLEDVKNEELDRIEKDIGQIHTPNVLREAPPLQEFLGV